MTTRFPGVRHLLAAAFTLLPLAVQATTYPLTVKDMDNQTVVINHEPRHVILQDGRDIMTLALLDRDNPFNRVIAWNNLLKKQDEQTWDVLRKAWPAAEKIPDMGFSDQGEVNNETVIASQPDLMIAQLRAKPALEQTGVVRRLGELHIPIVFVDYELHPLQNTLPSVTLLGKILNQEANAKAYTDFAQQRLDNIAHIAASQAKKPVVFIEPIAGVGGTTGACCFTHGHNGWGGLVEAVGAKNIGSDLLTGASGYISPEKVIAMQPDYYLMTGSKRGNSDNPLIPFGYNTDPAAIKGKFNTLLQRNAVAAIPAVAAGHVAGIYHHFYNHPWNIVGLEILAHVLYPQATPRLDPTADYHYIVTHFTHLPDAPITLSYQP